MLDKLRAEVLEANLELVRRGLVLYTFGNASAVSREEGRIAIKPSGVPYDKMTPADIVITDLEGNVVSGALRPSSDLPTHAALYRAFPNIGGVVHTHSRHATAWAQAGREIQCLGTTHADYFAGAIPVTANLSRHEIETDYELNTGHAIIRRMQGLDPLAYPGILVAGHAPFCWGETVSQAAHNAVVVEEIAAMAWQTITINPQVRAISSDLHHKHHTRKHGPQAYYGQKKGLDILGTQMAVSVHFYVEPLKQEYADGLERVELYLLRRYEALVQKPPANQRTDIEVITKTGTYHGGLRTNPPSGSVYVCPDLVGRNGEAVSLARVLKDNDIQVGQEVEVVIEGNTLTLA